MISTGSRRVVGPMMATIAVGALDMLLVTPLTGLLARAFETSPDAVGWVVTAYALASAIATPLLAPWIVRRGTVSSMRVGLLVLAAGNVAAAIVPNALGIAGLAAARAACGIGGGVAMTLCHVHVLQVLPREERASAIGWLTAGFFLATTFLLPLSTFLADRVSWRLSFGLVAAAVLACAWAVRRVPEGERGGAFTLAEYVPLLKGHGVPWGLMAYFGYGLGFTAVSTYLAPWLEQRFHVSTSAVGGVFLLSGAIAFLAAPWAGRAANAWGRRRVAIASNTLMAALFLLLPSLGGFALAAAAFAACNALASWRFTATMAALGELVPAARRGPLLLVNNTAILTGMAVGAALGGALYAGAGYAGTGTTAAAITLAASVFILGVRPAPATAEAPTVADASASADAHEPPDGDAGILPG